MQKIKTIRYKALFTVLTLLAVTNLYSRRNMNGNKGGTPPVVTAGCSNAVASASLQLNNVRTRIDATGGSMWQDRAGSFAEYEVPKRNNVDDPKFTSIFAGALWMGGTDVNGQLKIAAVTFRAQGNDFWPGPLDRSSAEINQEECAVFDQFWGVSRSQVNEFVAHYECESDPNCDALTEFPGYQVPDVIREWPAKGNIVQKGGSGTTYNVTEHLAPFFDRDGDDFYDPDAGDYPKYDLIGDIDCRTTRDIRLFGDTTIWFVFNDKGNTHTEAGGPSIGMEIRGQAFAFATNDEVNNMTFYNYEMINRSTFTLTNTYFGQWVDSDLGDPSDDFVGCDASRGLGFCYNGGPTDEDNPGAGTLGYGTTPPAIGVDFFEGPFADADGIDNPLTEIVQDALDSNGIPYPGLGIGYGDGIIDNERYGMRKFVYYSIGNSTQGDPNTALEYYNYLQGIWKDGSQMVWGGTGNVATGGTVPADILFPGDSDPLLWSTRGVNVTPTDWSEYNGAAGGLPNSAGDRRFLESAGPFILEPGAVNDLTVGVVFARAVSGDNLASIESLKVADDKAQSLFDNCFKIAEGPDAPDLTFQELDQELILYLTNRNVSNNFNESYNNKNPFIAIPDTMDGIYQGSDADKDTLKFYKFQGYQIYQVKNGVVTVSELDNPDQARLVAQVDLKDGITQLVNYTFDENLGANVPKEMVDGQDLGIKHSFRVTEDLFSTGDDSRLVNHKTYYFIAIAYGYNQYKFYDPLDPLKLDGQTAPYIASRKLAGGGGITSFSAVPHNPAPENGGTKTNSVYGDQPKITRKEGQGNGGNDLELTAESEESIVYNKFMDYPVYKEGKGPITVKVIDPLEVKAGVYQVQFIDTITPTSLDDAAWTLILPDGSDPIPSDQGIAIENEQLFLTQGISITIKQSKNPGVERDLGNGLIGSSIEYEDEALRWLGGFSDREGQLDANWIRSGTSTYGTSPGDDPYDDAFTIIAGTEVFKDPEQDYESMIDKTWAPYRLVSYRDAGGVILDAVGIGGAISTNDIEITPSVDIVFTSDKTKWSRCMVLEAQPTQALSDPITSVPTSGAKHLELRKANSVDKDGNDDGSGTGMGWFPGYAINVETGQRLNVAFAEDSWLAGQNGRDMIWNPTSEGEAGIANELVMGGKHYVYVFTDGNQGPYSFPTYDECATLYSALNAGGTTNQNHAFKTCVWAGIPMLNEGSTLLATTAKVKLRVSKPYKRFATASTFNNTIPLYEFDMTGMEAEIGSSLAADSALALLNVVPNPYFAYSEYETGKLDRRIKITNLPEECTISIYSVSGTLIRRFQKADATTSLDWELTNQVDVPVASGVYLMHILVPGVGERTLKWYGVMKPTDLNGF